jgi:hypothetical protein
VQFYSHNDGVPAGDGRLNRDMQETILSKTLVVLAATTSITVSLLAAPAAEARCRSCAAGAGVAAGMVTGTIVGSAIANTFFYASLGTIVAMRRLRRRLQSNQLDLDKDNNRF